MKKIGFTILLTCLSLSAFAQWNETGNNKTTGSLTVGGGVVTNNLLRINASSISELRFSTASSTVNGIIQAEHQGSGKMRMQFSTNNYHQGSNTVRMTINEEGYIGIGTQTPGVSLDVNGTIYGKEIFSPNIRGLGSLRIESQSLSELRLSTASTTVNGIIQAQHLGSGKLRMHFLTNNYHQGENNVRMTINEEGYVGIGTQTPGASLDVNGVIRGKEIVSSNIRGINSLKIESHDLSELKFSTASSTVNGIIRAEHLGSGKMRMHFLTHEPYHSGPIAEALRMTIDEIGNVGIGTANPTAKLDVAGTIKAREVVVEVPKGADFVFDQNYSLKSLSEVESFIIANKHLPEVQSEKEMQENGLNMNEFQIKLLQKVEELTLYIIQQDKRIQELEAGSQK